MPIKIHDFLSFLLDETLEEARMQHLCKPDPLGFRGARMALSECRHALSTQPISRGLRALLDQAREDTITHAGASDAWFWLTREAQIEWVASVVSVILLQYRIPTIVPPTRGAAIAAARLVGALPAA